MDYTGVIIEESLSNKEVLKEVKIIATEVEIVTETHRTPWLKQWTLHNVLVFEEKADKVAKALSKSIKSEHGSAWYADYKNQETHYIIFPNKIFKIDRMKPGAYEKPKNYGINLGIAPYQLDFSGF